MFSTELWSIIWRSRGMRSWSVHANVFWGQAGWERQFPNCEFFSTQAICRCVFACFSSPSIVLLTHNCGLPSKPINLVFFSSDVTKFCSVYPRFAQLWLHVKMTNRDFPHSGLRLQEYSCIHCRTVKVRMKPSFAVAKQAALNLAANLARFGASPRPLA